MKKSFSLQDLERRRDALKLQLSKLQADLTAIERTVVILREPQNNEEISGDSGKTVIPIQDVGTGEKVKPEIALLRVFSSEPERSWTPQELLEKIIEMKESIDTEAKFDRHIVHNALRRMDNRVIKDGNRRNAKYKLR